MSIIICSSLFHQGFWHRKVSVVATVFFFSVVSLVLLNQWWRTDEKKKLCLTSCYYVIHHFIKCNEIKITSSRASAEWLCSIVLLSGSRHTMARWGTRLSDRSCSKESSGQVAISNIPEQPFSKLCGRSWRVGSRTGRVYHWGRNLLH